MTGTRLARERTLAGEPQNQTLADAGLTCRGVARVSIGAGAVVTRDIGATVVAVGNPARVVKHLTP